MYRHSVVAQKQAGSTLARLYGVHGRLLRTEVALAVLVSATPTPAPRVISRPPRRETPRVLRYRKHIPATLLWTTTAFVTVTQEEPARTAFTVRAHRAQRTSVHLDGIQHRSACRRTRLSCDSRIKARVAAPHTWREKALLLAAHLLMETP